jgi:hypothetical protein
MMVGAICRQCQCPAYLNSAHLVHADDFESLSLPSCPRLAGPVALFLLQGQFVPRCITCGRFAGCILESMTLKKAWMEV